VKLGYYPGCALHGSSNDYEQSLRAALSALGVELAEVEDWICCGATAAHSLNRKLSIALPARNLALAAGAGHREVLAPCPLCSMQLLKAERALADDGTRREMAKIIEADPGASPRVLNLIQVFEQAGLDRIKAAVKQPLENIQAACYYGCLLTRPPETVQFDDCEQPRSMEKVVAVLGAKTVEWNYKTECCGAGMTLASEDTVLELSHRILANAAAHGANCIVTACPMCHVNLDMKQPDVRKRFGGPAPMPVYYLSDLVGLALGLDRAALGIDRHFVTTA
jgi:heterodisulfide reductase subunit B